jgi:hypothetical protein
LITKINFTDLKKIGKLLCRLTVKQMRHNAKSIRPFLGAKDFSISRSFYKDLGFEESILTHNLSYFKTNDMGFYLQDAYVRDWIDNTMVFLEVDDVSRYWNELLALDLTTRYKDVRLVPIRELDWGREFFLHDPSGILWHFGEFRKD